MTLKEAIQAMKEGHKVRHTYFVIGEYYWYNQATKDFYDEDGNQIGDHLWDYIQSQIIFEHGWAIYN